MPPGRTAETRERRGRAGADGIEREKLKLNLKKMEGDCWREEGGLEEEEAEGRRKEEATSRAVRKKKGKKKEGEEVKRAATGSD